ncbi:MAG: aquaporin [Streptococcus orisratti]|uniref:MIP/aquaporin family protein n=1 Tax=Streptococcus orisratti TaxID=114652 RepID=UPI002A90FEF0|nr:aquaporin [Streptococcus orisratti]MDY5636856.1 aquaporin [Streptococcus orisratti]
MKKFFAELLGTFVLVFLGTGAAVLGGGADDVIGFAAIGLAFGLTIVAAAYSIGVVSGAHLNPAVSIAMFVNKRMDAKDLLTYICGQVLGAFLATITLLSITGNSAALGQNVVADGHSLLAGFVVETILTFVFVLVILTVTSSKKGNASLAGLVIGLTLTLIHFVGIPVTGMSANPARSLAPAIFTGGAALSQIWIFIFAPILGAILAALVAKYLIDTEA